MGISRDAQIIAVSLFAFGVPQAVNFARGEASIHPRTLAALNELTEAGLITRSTGWAARWEAAEAIGTPINDFEAIGPGESFPITVPYVDGLMERVREM